MEYYYGQEADMFIFYRLPKLLFTDPRYKPLPTDAKLLYGMMLDRMGLSRKNHMQDEQGRTYIIFRQEEAMELLGIGKDKAVKIYRALEEAELIERKRRGLTLPDIIYVGRLTPIPETKPAAATSRKAPAPAEREKNAPLNAKKSRSAKRKNRAQQSEKTEIDPPHTFNTNKTEGSKTIYQSYRSTKDGATPETALLPLSGTLSEEEAKSWVTANIDTAYLIEKYPDQKENILGMADIIVDELTSARPAATIGGTARQREDIISRLKEITTDELEAIALKLERREPGNKIYNWRGYLLTSLYYARETSYQVYEEN